MYLDLVPIELDGAQPGLLDALGAAVAPSFGLVPRVRRLTFAPAGFLDPVRGQYNSSRIIRHLAELVAGERILGVAGVDLFVPVFSFVLGEAMLEGPAALVSCFRLRNGKNGVAVPEELVMERLVKSAIHEIGHTYGLLHCLDPACVMHSATFAAEVDLKSAEPCGRCTRTLRG